MKGRSQPCSKAAHSRHVFVTRRSCTLQQRPGGPHPHQRARQNRRTTIFSGAGVVQNPPLSKKMLFSRTLGCAAVIHIGILIRGSSRLRRKSSWVQSPTLRPKREKKRMLCGCASWILGSDNEHTLEGFIDRHTHPRCCDRLISKHNSLQEGNARGGNATNPEKLPPSTTKRRFAHETERHHHTHDTRWQGLSDAKTKTRLMHT